MKWVKLSISTMKPWEGANLRVIPYNVLPTSYSTSAIPMYWGVLLKREGNPDNYSKSKPTLAMEYEQALKLKGI